MTLLLRYQHRRGDHIPGSSTLDRYEGWMELQSLEFEGGRKIHMTHDGAGLAGENLPYLTEVVVTKRCDRASPLLLQAALQGGEGDIEVVLLAGITSGPRIEFLFRNARVGTYRIQLEGSIEVERLAIVYASFDMTFRGELSGPSMPENVSISYEFDRAR